MNKKFDRQEVIDALNKKGVNRPCHRCGHTSFSVIDGFSSLSITEELGKAVLGGPSVPMILTACNNCGFVNAHATGALFNNQSNNQSAKTNGGK